MMLAISPSDLHPVSAPNISGALLAALVAALILVVALIVAAVLGSRAKSATASTSTTTARRAGHDKTDWIKRINSVVNLYNAKEISREQAFARLAKITRSFAGEASGKDMSARTLSDLNRLPRNASNQETLDRLRQTVAALYPPEFADASRNRSARETTVADAAGWVTTLVERWQ